MLREEGYQRSDSKYRWEREQSVIGNRPENREARWNRQDPMVEMLQPHKARASQNARSQVWLCHAEKPRNPRCRPEGTALHEEVQEEEGEAEEYEEGAERETAAGELRDGMVETDGDDAETGLAAAQIEGTGGDVAGEIAAKEGEFVINPEGEFVTMTPQVERAENKDAVAQAGKNAELWTVTPIQHVTSQRAGRPTEIKLLRES